MKIDRGIFRLALPAGELLRLDARGGVEVTEESQAARRIMRRIRGEPNGRGEP